MFLLLQIRGQNQVDSLLKASVLDQGFVELLDVMPFNGSCDLAVVNAARTSYLGESKGEVADKKLLNYLIRNHHDTPLEMVSFKFRIRSPAVCFWQWVRHRAGSFNFSSARYLEIEEDQFYVPKEDEWRLQAKFNKQMSDGLLDLNKGTYLTQGFEELIKASYTWYETALSYGVAREQARLMLPMFSSYYTAIWSVNARNLIHFLRLRLAEEAQYEIRVYARAIYEMLKVKMPWTCEYLETNEVTPWVELKSKNG